VELLELAVILLFWFFDTPSRVDAQASAAPACPNTSPLPLVPALESKRPNTLDCQDLHFDAAVGTRV